jgi:hypothetical protein
METIDRLRTELDVLEKGGYEPSVHEPHRNLRIFRDSVSCPNVGLETKVEPCTNCFLIDFVPEEHRKKEDACHYIPLNKRGDTVASLSNTTEEVLHDTVRTWLKETIHRLTEDKTPHSREPSTSPRLLSSGDGESHCLMRRTVWQKN